MKSAPPATADLVNLLRQQLILAQVRIMEFEDVRDAQELRLAELERLFQQAQTLADTKLDEASHLGKLLTDTRGRCEELTALREQALRQIATAETSLNRARSDLARRAEAVGRLEAELRQLNATLGAMQSSRSWRWTAWLRALLGEHPDRKA